MAKRLQGLKESHRWVYCPMKGDWVAFVYCMFSCRHLREKGGMYADDKVLCGWDNSVRNVVRKRGEKPREFKGEPRIFGRKRTVTEKGLRKV